MKDTPADTGVEPNSDAGPMYVSEDIWVRQHPIPGYQPYAFATDPMWLTAISPLHQNPEYRDPQISQPNYVYVRVRNRGSTASSGTERLRVYWAKASTGLTWPAHWVNYVTADCGPSKLYGDAVTTPLTVPILQAGGSCVIEIPWYPPNPADYSCLGADQGHVSLLARIETSTNAPFGMTFAETSNISDNTRNNNNTVWKNATVVESLPGLLLAAPTWVRNVSPNDTVPMRLDLRVPPGNAAIFNFGAVEMDLGQELFARWLQTGAKGQGIERVGGTRLQMFGTNASVFDIPLFPGEVQRVEVQLRLNPQYPNPQGQTFTVDLEQRGTPTNPDDLIGGQRFQFNFNKLVLVPTGGGWRYWDTGQFPGSAWAATNYNDSLWPTGPAQLGMATAMKTPLSVADRRARAISPPGFGAPLICPIHRFTAISG